MEAGEDQEGETVIRRRRGGGGQNDWVLPCRTTRLHSLVTPLEGQISVTNTEPL